MDEHMSKSLHSQYFVTIYDDTKDDIDVMRSFNKLVEIWYTESRIGRVSLCNPIKWLLQGLISHYVHKHRKPENVILLQKPSHSFRMSCSCSKSICEMTQQWTHGSVTTISDLYLVWMLQRRCGIVMIIFHPCVRMTTISFFGICQSKEIRLLELTGLTWDLVIYIELFNRSWNDHWINCKYQLSKVVYMTVKKWKIILSVFKLLIDSCLIFWQYSNYAVVRTQ